MGIPLLKSAKSIAKDATKARDQKCEPVAQEIIQIIARANPSVKDMSKEWDKVIKEYGPIQVQVNRMMKEKGLTISEVNYTWSIVQQVIDAVKRLSNESIQRAYELAEAKLFKVENLSDVSLQDVDNILIM